MFDSFHYGRPQFFATLLLLAFLGQCLWLVLPHVRHDVDVSKIHASLKASSGGYFRRLFPEIIEAALNRLPAAANPEQQLHYRGLPTIAFGLWLAGALWWVTRRLYGDAGGYVALSLYCFSPYLVVTAALWQPDVFVAWGLFGLVFTAIGLAHTLLAPPAKWRIRLLILGFALGVTATSHPAAGVMGVLFAAAFMLYLSPGRRRLAMALLLASALLGGVVFLAAAGFRTDIIFAAAGAFRGLRIALPPRDLFIGRELLSSLPVLLLLAFCLLAYGLWPRARYFGNTAPLLVAAPLFFLRQDPAASPWLWALPFLYAFLGGVCADLLETRRRRLVAGLLIVLLAASAAGGLATVARVRSLLDLMVR